MHGSVTSDPHVSEVLRVIALDVGGAIGIESTPGKAGDRGADEKGSGRLCLHTYEHGSSRCWLFAIRGQKFCQ